MKAVLILFVALCLVPLTAYAQEAANPLDDLITIDASSTNVPTAYDATGGSQVSIDFGGNKKVDVVNTTGEDIVGSTKGPATCGVSSDDTFFVPAGGSNSFIVSAGANLCLRTDTGFVANTGKVYIQSKRY